MRILFRTVFSVLLVWTVGCASGPTSSQTPPTRAQLLVDLAQSAYAEGDYTAALANLFEAEKLESDNYDLFHLKSLVYYRREEYSKAIEAGRRALEIDPKSYVASNTLGRILIDAGQLDEAEKVLLIAIADPLNAQAYKSYTNLGIIYYRRGKWNLADQEFQRAIKQNGALACVAHYYRGHLKMKDGKVLDAIRDYDRATKKVCGSFAEAHLALGIAYSRGKQFDLARKKFVEIQQLYPDSSVAQQAVERMRSVP
jgi:type IV pilus assembly protein PilF